MDLFSSGKGPADGGLSLHVLDGGAHDLALPGAGHAHAHGSFFAIVRMVSARTS